MTREGVRTDVYRMAGERLPARVWELDQQGNIRRIVIQDRAGRILFEVPLAPGVVGPILRPVWAAVGATAALSAANGVVVERVARRKPGRRRARGRRSDRHAVART